MAIKDYYEILELGPGATDHDIKKAYRKLAMRYHPDKNHGNAFAIHYFREIKEAYEILSNPVRRNEYHQSRWQYSPNKPHYKQARHLTPKLIIEEAKKIEMHVRSIDVFRMNHPALQQRLQQLLSEKHLEIMERATQEESKILIASILNSLRPLEFPFLQSIIPSLVRIAGVNNDFHIKIHRFEKLKRWQYLGTKYNGLIVVLLALGICILIYLLSQ